MDSFFFAKNTLTFMKGVIFMKRYFVLMNGKNSVL